MVLTILGLGNTSAEFQTELHDRIGEWESFDDSHNGGWGPAAVSLALAAYGAPGYEIRAYDDLRRCAARLGHRDHRAGQAGRHVPVVGSPHLGHDRLPRRCRPHPVRRCGTSSGAYILDPWYPRISSIWGASDPPGNFEDLAELERNWPAYEGPPGFEQIGPGWTRPEGAYPDRDGRFVVLVPTIPLSSVTAGPGSRRPHPTREPDRQRQASSPTFAAWPIGEADRHGDDAERVDQRQGGDRP